MRVALFQGPAVADVAGALAEVTDAARSAAASGARILVCSELTCTGYRRPWAPEPRPSGLETGGDRGRSRVGPSPVGDGMARAAREAGIAIAYGYLESGAPDDAPAGGAAAMYSSVAVLGPDGAPVAHYRKTHLYRPFDGALTPGDELIVQFPLGALTFGILVCYDVEFPETVRAHALAGTDVLLVPTALAYPDDHVARILVPARAVESQLFIAYVNRIGQEPGPDGDGADGGAGTRGSVPVTYFCGRSCAVAPDGTEFARAGDDAEVLVVDIDPELLARSRERNTYLADRRTDLYRGGERR